MNNFDKSEAGRKWIVFFLALITPFMVVGSSMLFLWVAMNAVGMLVWIPLIVVIPLTFGAVFIAPLMVGDWTAERLRLGREKCRLPIRAGTVLGLLLFGSVWDWVVMILNASGSALGLH